MVIWKVYTMMHGQKKHQRSLVVHVPHPINSGWPDELLQWPVRMVFENIQCPMPAVALTRKVFGKTSNRRSESNIKPYVVKQDGKWTELDRSFYPLVRFGIRVIKFPVLLLTREFCCIWLRNMLLDRTLSTVNSVSDNTSKGLVCKWVAACGLPTLCDVVCILHTRNRRLLYILCEIVCPSRYYNIEHL